MRSTSFSIEKTVGFFGAADSRTHLFFLTTALNSVRRFHPHSSYFALLPEVEVRVRHRWIDLLRAWSDGGVQPLALPEKVSQRQFVARSGAAYSSMTFHRHRVPQMLMTMGLQYSINLDPDVLCLRPWDFSFLPQVELLAGRPVGSGLRTTEWLSQLSAQPGSDTRGGPSNETVTDWLYMTLNITRRVQMRHAREINGGIMVFNNSAATRYKWVETVARYHAKLHHVIEGDQDLIGFVLAANPTFGRYDLPSVYNYGFRRDRERLPYDVARRLRHGLFSQQIVNVHFVADGKPWQLQNLTVYPMWLLVSRLYYVSEWLTLARKMRPRLPYLRLADIERRAIGPIGLAVLRASALRNTSLKAMVDERTLQRCRCFLRNLHRDKKADAMLLLRRASKAEMPRATPGQTSGSPGTAQTHATSSPEQIRALVDAQRGAMLWACGAASFDRGPPPEERRACDSELGENREKFLCALSAEKFGYSRHSRKASNCSETGIDPEKVTGDRLQPRADAHAPTRIASAKPRSLHPIGRGGRSRGRGRV